VPSQVPVCPHVVGPWSWQSRRGSAPPTSIGRQVPMRPVWSQLTQAPRHAMLQQTPSVQKPEAQSPSLLHTAPRGLGPQLPFTHAMPGTQSALDWQVTTQASVVSSQLNGAQIVAGPALHRPSPSQTLTPMTAASEHIPGLQIVPATCWRQAPLPSQVPSSPQLEASPAGQMAGERGAPPVGTGAQIPGDPCTLHDRQVPVQAVLQQTPSTQNPLWQSPSQPQVSPFGRSEVAAPVHPGVVSGDASLRVPVLFPDPPHAPTTSAIATAKTAIAAARLKVELVLGTPRKWGFPCGWQARATFRKRDGR
jgi:hypothetical protein